MTMKDRPTNRRHLLLGVVAGAALLLAFTSASLFARQKVAPAASTSPESATSSTSANGLPSVADITAAVEDVLANQRLKGHPALPREVRLLSVQERGDTIILDFSKALLSNGTGAQFEEAMSQIITQIGSLPGLSSTNNADPIPNHIDFLILVNGVPLEHATN